MLYDIIRDFFVIYVFGGTDTNGNNFGGILGSCQFDTYGIDFYGIGDIFFEVGSVYDAFNDGVGPLYITLSDWLSTTATIITLVALLVGISCLMVSLFRWIVRLVSLRG